jgi:hypothetical protein
MRDYLPNKEGMGVHGKAALYFSIALLSPVAAMLGEAAKVGQWPSILTLTACVVGGIVAGLVAVRAFYDGSAERYKQTNKAKE